MKTLEEIEKLMSEYEDLKHYGQLINRSDISQFISVLYYRRHDREDPNDTFDRHFIVIMKFGIVHYIIEIKGEIML